jgi:hypothetical protein
MNVFLFLFRLIFKNKLSLSEKKKLIDRLKSKRNSYKIKRDGL